MSDPAKHNAPLYLTVHALVVKVNSHIHKLVELLYVRIQQ